MKISLIALVLTELLCGFANAQPGVPPAGDSYSLLSGEHTPVIYTGSGEASSSAGYTTQWLQIGYSPSATTKNNNNIGRFNPEQFTLGMTLTLGSGADSSMVSTARFELAYDTTVAAFWVGDSSNTFIGPTSSSRLDYGVWTFNKVLDTAHGRLYPLRVLQGGYIRFVFETTTSDEVVIDWTLTGEH